MDPISIEIYCIKQKLPDTSCLELYKISIREATALISPKRSSQTVCFDEMHRVAWQIRGTISATIQRNRQPDRFGVSPRRVLGNPNYLVVIKDGETYRPDPRHSQYASARFEIQRAPANFPRRTPTFYLIPGEIQLLLVVADGFVAIRRACTEDKRFFSAPWPYS
ncbi:hypothetical protein AAVH_18857 [Aphelenchoides avenae]|nr:hypothetical protein AAVH_18857 [Aphelenchus avenae]